MNDNTADKNIHVPEGQSRPDVTQLSDEDLAKRITSGTFLVNQMHAELAVQHERGHEPLEEAVEMLRRHERYLNMLRDERRRRMG